MAYRGPPKKKNPRPFDVPDFEAEDAEAVERLDAAKALLTAIEDLEEDVRDRRADFLDGIQAAVADMVDRATRGRPLTPKQGDAIRNWAEAVSKMGER